MGRLVAFGCSFTYGEGLPDCISENCETNPTPSKFAWPNLLAKAFSLECVNNGFPGRSNKNILFDVLRADLNPDDSVVFLWASVSRGVIFSEPNQMHNILPGSDDSFMKRNYYTLHNDYDLAMQSMLDIHHANVFLSTKNIKVYNFFFENILKDSNLQRDLKIPMQFLNFQKLWCDYALDDAHPGIRTQQNIAKAMFECIVK